LLANLIVRANYRLFLIRSSSFVVFSWAPFASDASSGQIEPLLFRRQFHQPSFFSGFDLFAFALRLPFKRPSNYSFPVQSRCPDSPSAHVHYAPVVQINYIFCNLALFFFASREIGQTRRFAHSPRLTFCFIRFLLITFALPSLSLAIRQFRFTEPVDSASLLRFFATLHWLLDCHKFALLSFASHLRHSATS
jgi:hypothetical protein